MIVKNLKKLNIDDLKYKFEQNKIPNSNLILDFNLTKKLQN